MVDGSLRFTGFQVLTAAKMGKMNWLETVMTALKKDQLDKKIRYPGQLIMQAFRKP